MQQKKIISLSDLECVREIFIAHDVNHILLVTGKNSFVLSGAKEALLPYLSNKIVTHYCDFDTNPKMNKAKFGINLIKQSNPDLIIAIGGGSVIDMAKLINILATQHTDNLEIVKNNKRIQNKGLPLIAIPTTVGTGSEATHFAVVYIDKVKYSLAHEYMLPDYAIIAPALSYNLPRHIIASSGLDALSQAIESYWAIGSTIESKQYAAEAISLILPAIKKAVCEQNKPAIYSMAIAANLAGKAINISKTTAAHALSYPITTHFNIPHGHAVALTLGKFFIINSLYNACDIQDKRGEIYLNRTMKELFTLFGCNDAVLNGTNLLLRLV